MTIDTQRRIAHLQRVVADEAAGWPSNEMDRLAEELRQLAQSLDPSEPRQTHFGFGSFDNGDRDLG